jgi:CRP/FNR family cyclic AMP-dependent transcriptional regulator
MAELPGASDDLRALAARGVPYTYEKGRLLIREGELGDTLFIILEGRVRAYAAHPSNGREINYGTYGPGEYVGEMSLDGGPRSATVQAVERSCCAVVGRPTLETFLAERPSFAFELLTKVIRRARAATLSMRQMALNDVYGRLREWLEQRADDGPEGWRVVAPKPTHRQMALELGCSREMVSRLLKDLERGGHMQVADDHLLLTTSLPKRW